MKKKLVWNVYVEDFNARKIKTFNVLSFSVILDKLDQKYHLSELLNMQLRNLGLSEKAKVLSLKVPTNSQAETIYECIKQEQIEGGIFVKDADGYFTCDFTETNGIAIYPLDKLDMVNPPVCLTAT